MNVSTGVFCEFLKQGWCRRGDTNSPTNTEPNTPHSLWKHSPHTHY
jgi:hypothetical protein